MDSTPPLPPAGERPTGERLAADAQLAAQFQAERPRLIALATRILSDPGEAEDAVQQAWLRLDAATTPAAATAPAAATTPAEATTGLAAPIDNLAAWLTTVTTRLCLDRLRRRTPVPEEEIVPEGTAPDPAEDVALADTVGIALQLVLDRLSPNERIAFVMHDSFGFEFSTIAAALGTSEQAARKLASRARAKVSQPRPEDALADWEIVDAFMDAARGGEFTRLVELLAPTAVVRGDAEAIAAGTPQAIDGGEAIARFFNGSAHAALPVTAAGRPGAAWYHRGEARVLFDFTLEDGRITRIDFRAAPDVLAGVERRRPTA